MGVGGQHHAPAALPPGKTRYTLYRRLGRPQGWSGRVRKISPLTGVRSPDRPARSASLYRLSYRGPTHNVKPTVNLFTLSSPLVTIRTAEFNALFNKNCISPSKRLLCVSGNSQNKQRQTVDFPNGDAVCFL